MFRRKSWKYFVSLNIYRTNKTMVSSWLCELIDPSWLIKKNWIPVNLRIFVCKIQFFSGQTKITDRKNLVNADSSKDCAKISRPYLLYFPKKYAVKWCYGRLGSGRFMILNDSASPKMVIKLYFNFCQFFKKILELFECRPCDLYMTDDRNFAHS